MRVLIAAVMLLSVTGVPTSADAANRITLRAVERAFYEARIPFSADWQPKPSNPYLVPRSSVAPAASLPNAFRPHLIGSAWYLNSATFKSRTVYVFDSASIAATYLAWAKHHCTCDGSVILVARNVAYTGSPSAAVTKTMARLTR